MAYRNAEDVKKFQQLHSDIRSDESSALVHVPIENKNFESIADAPQMRENNYHYQDTIQRLKERVNQL